MGHQVTCLDIDEYRIKQLQNGIMPIYEPGLKQIVEQNVEAGRLDFTTSYKEALHNVEFAFIAVGTPSSDDGEADLQYIKMAADSIAEKNKMVKTHPNLPLYPIQNSSVKVPP